MKFSKRLIKGKLIKRYKRFFADINIKNEIITAHCPNTGSMMGLLDQNNEVWISKNNDPKRKLKYTAEIIEADGCKVGINTLLTNKIILESLDFPVPVISVSVEPLSQDDQDNLTTGLIKLSEEDPTFTVKTDEDTAQTIISGMGELHLEIIVDRLKREFNVGVHTGSPQVAYKESITKTVENVEGKFVRQSGGRGQYGHVII